MLFQYSVYIFVIRSSIVLLMTIQSSARQIQKNSTLPVLWFLLFFLQILHVYVTKYESAGQFWPIVHNATIFSLVLTQVIAVAVFGMKKSPMASGCTIPLIIISLLFNEYCRKRFSQVFKRNPAQVISTTTLTLSFSRKLPQPFSQSAVQVLIEMDRRDEQWGKEEGIYNRLRSEYCQLAYISRDLTISKDFSVAGPNRQNGTDHNSPQGADENSLKQGMFVVSFWWFLHSIQKTDIESVLSTFQELTILNYRNSGQSSIAVQKTGGA